MKTHGRQTVPLGDLIVVAYDEAARYTKDPAKVTLLATRAVLDLIRRGSPVTPKVGAPR